MVLVAILQSGMRPSVAWAVCGLTGWFLIAQHRYLPAVIFGVLAVAVYLVSLRWWPTVTCWRCGGSFRRRGWGIFRGFYRRGCRSKWCDGGHRLRLGARVLGTGGR